jgi:hypothetical protein
LDRDRKKEKKHRRDRSRSRSRDESRRDRTRRDRSLSRDRDGGRRRDVPDPETGRDRVLGGDATRDADGVIRSSAGGLEVRKPGGQDSSRAAPSRDAPLRRDEYDY